MSQKSILFAAIASIALAIPSGASAQLLSANVGGIGASIGGSTYSYAAPSSNQYYYPNSYSYYQSSTPVRQTVRYSQTTTYPSANYSSSYNYYPAYYNTGYSYPAASYNYYNYSAPSYGTGVSVGVGL